MSPRDDFRGRFAELSRYLRSSVGGCLNCGERRKGRLRLFHVSLGFFFQFDQ